MSVNRFVCIDAHTCGNPVRLIKEGHPVLIGKDMSEKRQHFISEFDWIRKGIMFEPRGHDMMSGSILYPPHDPQNDVAVLFIETSGCLPMCGHGTIGTITIAIEKKLILPKIKGIVRMETPAGLVIVTYQQEGEKVKTVKLTNVASFLHSSNLSILRIVLFKAAVTYYGRVRCWINLLLLEMLFFMAKKPLTEAHVERVPVQGWLNGMQKGS